MTLLSSHVNLGGHQCGDAEAGDPLPEQDALAGGLEPSSRARAYRAWSNPLENEPKTLKIPGFDRISDCKSAIFSFYALVSGGIDGGFCRRRRRKRCKKRWRTP